MTYAEDIAAALSRTYELAKKYGAGILLSSDIPRTDRELLVHSKWLIEIIKGWYMLVKPGIGPGDSSIWYSNFWDFLRVYLEHHYGEEYCLSSQNSLELHVGSTIIPEKVVVITKQGGGKLQELLFNTSIFVYADRDHLPKERIKNRGIQLMTLPHALCKIPPSYFKEKPQEIEIALKMIRQPSDLAEVIVQHKMKRAAARIIGAYYFFGDEKTAKMLENDLNAVNIHVKPENPFQNESPFVHLKKNTSPYASRIIAMWNRYREDVILNFPEPVGLPRHTEEYLEQMEEIYAFDAYNSLSIEGYQVDAKLIAKVKDKKWDPDLSDSDRKERNALAARGYFEAHLEVKKSISKILQGIEVGETIEEDLRKWYRALFHPSVRAGIIGEEDLFGYRKAAVFIRNSRHVPLPREALLDAMEAFFLCLKEENHPAVKAVLGHFIFVFIHPYIDGNGRIGRFLMNAALASGGYPWTVVQVKNRLQYLQALEMASVKETIIPLTKFLASEIQWIR